MRLVMGLHSFVAVMGRMKMVGMREVRVVRSLFVMTGGIMLRRMMMVFGRVLMMLGGFGVMGIRHGTGPFILFRLTVLAR